MGPVSRPPYWPAVTRPHKQAGYMTASDCTKTTTLQKALAKGPSIHVPSIRGNHSAGRPWTLGTSPGVTADAWSAGQRISPVQRGLTLRRRRPIFFP